MTPPASCRPLRAAEALPTQRPARRGTSWSDRHARAIANHLAEGLGTTVVVKNKVGANGNIAGQTQVLMNGRLATLPFVQAQRLKVLAVSKPTRVPLLAGVPTIAETLRLIRLPAPRQT